MFVCRDLVFRMQQGETDRAIYRATGVGRKKLKRIRALAQSQGWLNPERELAPNEALASVLETPMALPSQMVSPLSVYQKQIEDWVAQKIRVTAIHAALKRNHGYTGSYSAVLRFVQRISPQELPEAFVPLDFEPGEAAQIDFGQGPLLLDPVDERMKKSWVFVMTLCFSRHMFVCFVFDQSVPTWLSCHRRGFECFGGVPRKIILDNPKAAIVRACYYDPGVQRSYYEFAEAYGFLISPCKVATPEHKGRVESGVKFAKGSFIPLRTFRDIHDADRQALVWCVEEAGLRIHGRTHQKPFEVFTAIEKSVLKSLPSEPFQGATWKKVTVHGDCCVVFQKVYYSVPFRLVGQELWLRATDTTVQIYQAHQLIVIHPKATRPGVRQTLEEHFPPHKMAWLMKTPQWCLTQAKEVGPSCLAFIERLFGDKVLDRLRAAQGVLSFRKNYTDARLEAACRRALHYESIGRGVIKRILEEGLDKTAPVVLTDPPPMAEPRYGRSIGMLLQSQN